jgi:F-type H+-transporting ATPase subunit epsilon
MHLDIVTQQKKVFSDPVDQITAPAIMGEITILPGHIPLISQLDDGIITVSYQDKVMELAVLGGFIDVSPNGHVTIVADTAITAADASEARAKAARDAAQLAMQQKTNEREFKQAEHSLRKAILELKIARRRRQSPPQP